MALWIESVGAGEPFHALQRRVKPDEIAAIASGFWTECSRRTPARRWSTFPQRGLIAAALGPKGDPDRATADYSAVFGFGHRLPRFRLITDDLVASCRVFDRVAILSSLRRQAGVTA